MSTDTAQGLAPTVRAERRREWFTFILLAVLIWPVIAVGVVAGWGFVVWMFHIFVGPPGPGPGHP